MAFECIIIEDQLPAQRVLTRYIEDIPELELSGTFTDPLKALAFLRQHPVDLIFLDVHLPKISGIDFLKLLPYQPKVILTTAFSEYALEGYEYDLVDYLLKPITFERFLKAVSRVIYRQEETPNWPTPAPSQPVPQTISDHIFVKSDRKIIKIALHRIIYIKAEDDYTRVITSDKKYLLSYTLKYWQDLLLPEKFCRIHKSFIINLDFVERIEGNMVYMTQEKNGLPVGRSFRENFLQMIDLKE